MGSDIMLLMLHVAGPPSQSLGVDPVDPQVMRRPPRKKDSPIISNRLLLRVLFSATLMVVGTMFVYVFALSDDHMSRREQTMVSLRMSFLSACLPPLTRVLPQTFTCFVFLDLVSAVQNRGLGCGLTQNKMLCGTVSVSLIVQLALVYVPFLQSVFQTEALTFHDLGTLVVLATVSFAAHEGRRVYERRLDADAAYVTAVEELA